LVENLSLKGNAKATNLNFYDLRDDLDLDNEKNNKNHLTGKIRFFNDEF